jgi:glycosyltransferase involved in cell wall biosynthesis
MSKPLLVFQGPVATRSGYGDHCRDLLKSLFDMDKFDIKIVPTRWGNTPQNQITGETELGRKIVRNLITQLDRQPDVYIQVTVANEFRPIGKFNIGVTAGVETTAVPKEFIDGCNKMDLILVPSEFTKEVLLKTNYSQVDNRTGQQQAVIRLQRPVEVLFEGLNLAKFNKIQPPVELDILDGVEEDFNFLFVGHWLQGQIGEDRKDIGMMVKTFCTVFKDFPKDKRPGLILKTSSAGFDVMGREMIANKLRDIKNDFGDKCPSIYLLYGDMKEEELNRLYNHDKCKAFLCFTKGEGYGRPIQEFAVTGKPILVSKWSGHTMFLPEDNTVYLEGKLTNVHESAANQFLMKESKWFTVDYSKAADKIYKVYQGYPKYLKDSQKLSMYTKTNFSLEKMTDRFEEILDQYVKVAKKVELKLPEITKL